MSFGPGGLRVQEECTFHVDNVGLLGIFRIEQSLSQIFKF